MKPADQESGYLKALFYGAPGSTKTRTAASAVFVKEMGPVLMLESAGNPLSIRDYDPQPTIVTMESLKDYGYPYDYFLQGQPLEHPFAKWCKDVGIKLPDEPFRTLIVDGLTEVQRFAFRAVKPGLDGLPGAIPPDTELRDFNKVLAIMTNWAYKYITLPDLHVILTSLEAEKMDKVGNIFKRPLLWGQSQGEIASYVYLVMRLTQAENLDSRSKSVVANELAESNSSDTIGFIRATSSFYAKDQYGIRNGGNTLARYMFDPTIQKIWDAING